VTLADRFQVCYRHSAADLERQQMGRSETQGMPTATAAIRRLRMLKRAMPRTAHGPFAKVREGQTTIPAACRLLATRVQSFYLRPRIRDKPVIRQSSIRHSLAQSSNVGIGAVVDAAGAAAAGPP
jgi:hypothetical protein